LFAVRYNAINRGKFSTQRNFLTNALPKTIAAFSPARQGFAPHAAIACLEKRQ
jgi:hypothetical protein